MIINDICVLGGSGFVGRHVCNALAARGLRVTVPARDRERAKVDLITLPTVDVVTADIHDPEALREVTRGCEAVINLVGVLHGGRGKASFEQAHVELPRKVVEACRRNGIRRLIQMSALNAAVNAPSEYLRSKGEAENIVRLSGLDVTIFRPSVIFGRDDQFLNLFAGLTRTLPVIVLGSPNARFQPVFVEDVATAFAESVTRLESFGQSYDLVGPKVYALRELVRYVGHITGHPRPIVGLGDAPSRLQASLMGMLPIKLLTRDNYLSMKVDSVSHQPFPFGIAPEPLEAAAPRWLARQTPRARYPVFRNRAHRTDER
ncbi:MAG: complex I NDUFA9 subunit family protein [Burkholderiales bacterium]